MAIHVDERYEVSAPIGPVWDFLVDPRRVVACVPGGELHRVLDDRTYVGTVKVKVGPLALAYGGRVHLAEVDVPGRRVTIVGEAHETAGTDTARLTLESWLLPCPGGGTEVVAHARVDVTGRIVELGRGVLEQLGHIVFREFASAVRARVEAEEARRAAIAAGTPAAAPDLPPRPPPLRAIPVVLRALRAWVAGKLRAGDGTERPRPPARALRRSAAGRRGP